MATRQEVLDAIKQADERLERLQRDIILHADTPLLEGTWRVRDCLSHLAARSRVTSVFQTSLNRLAAIKAGQPIPQTNIDDVNHNQVVERKGLSTPELLSQMQDGHSQATKELQATGDEVLGRMVPNFRGGGESSIADGVLRNIKGHESGHMDAVEAAIAAAKARRT